MAIIDIDTEEYYDVDLIQQWDLQALALDHHIG